MWMYALCSQQSLVCGTARISSAGLLWCIVCWLTAWTVQRCCLRPAQPSTRLTTVRGPRCTSQPRRWHTHTQPSVSELTLFLIDTYKFGVVRVYCPLVFVMLTYFLLRFKYESACMCRMVFWLNKRDGLNETREEDWIGEERKGEECEERKTGRDGIDG